MHCSFNLLLPLLLLAGHVTAQQPGLLIYGKVDDMITATELKGLRVSVQEVGADTSTRIYAPITAGRWTYEFTLSEQKHYEVRAEAPGKISRYIWIDARGVPQKSWSDGHGICLDIALLDSIPGHDLSAFDAPFGIARFHRGYFRWDMAKTKVMREHTEALLKKTGQKMATRPRQ